MVVGTLVTSIVVVVVGRSVGTVAQVADRISVMYAGRLAEVGNAADVLAIEGDAARVQAFLDSPLVP